MVVIVCGGRSFADRGRVFAELDRLHAESVVSLVKVGDCPSGVDRFVAEWAVERGIRCSRFVAGWRHFGKSAGPRRNAAMVSAGADLALAFPGGKGTASLRRLAARAGIAVRSVLVDGLFT